MTRVKKVLMATGLSVAVIAMGITALHLYICVSIDKLYAPEWVASAIILYMEGHAGEWPKAWEDLRPYLGDDEWYDTCRKHIGVDWSADPVELAAMPQTTDAPPFHVVYASNGKQMPHYVGSEPNSVIHKWLNKHAKVLTNLLDSANSGGVTNP